MSSYVLNDKLKQHILTSSLLVDQKENLLSSPTISHVNLIRFYCQCKPTGTLIELLQQTQLHVPKNEPEKKEKTPEFIKTMEYLRLRAKEEEYQRLVNPAPAAQLLYEPKFDDEKITPAQASKELKNQITTIVNVLISVGSVVYAIWYWTDSSWKLQSSYRVLLCLFFGILVLVAEVVVYLGYLNKIEDAKVKERSKKEVKKIIRTVEH